MSSYSSCSLNEKALDLELERAIFLRQEEKIIIEILRDGALTINEVKNRLAKEGIDLHFDTVKKRINDLNEEGWVIIK